MVDARLLPSCFLHRVDEFEEGFRSHFLIASHSVFPAIVVNYAHRELHAVGLAGRRGQRLGQIEKTGRSNQFLDASGDAARQRGGVERDRRRQNAGETATASERDAHVVLKRRACSLAVFVPLVNSKLFDDADLFPG